NTPDRGGFPAPRATANRWPHETGPRRSCLVSATVTGMSRACNGTVKRLLTHVSRTVREGHVWWQTPSRKCHGAARAERVRAGGTAARPGPADRPAFAPPAGLAAPAGYSHVVAVPSGRLVWTSGQVGADVDGVAGDGWEAQTRLVFANVGHALRAAGAGWEDVVKLTFYVVDTSELPLVRAIRDEFVDTARPPTSTLVQVAGPP